MILKEHLEREVKLRTPPGFRLPDYPGRFIPRRVFTSTYFDTKRYALGRLGITLRRRIEQNKTKWQLKLPTASSRLELEIAGKPGYLPPEFRDLLFGLLQQEEAMPIAKLRTVRYGFQVHHNGKTLAEITQDSVALLDGRQIKRRFSETEIELIDGNEKDLLQIKDTMTKAGAFDGDPRPKVFQALALDLPESPPRIDPSAPPIDHLKAILKRQVREILVHDPGTRLGRDPEELHQMRVATRRFRALLRTGHVFLDTEWMTLLRQEVGWLGGILGTVRDYDVLLEDLQHEIETLSQDDQTTFKDLLRILDSQREAARATMLEELQSPRFLMVLNQLEHAAYFPESVSTEVTLQEISANQYRKLRRCVQKWDKNCSNEDLHQIRIRAKRARYAAELAEHSMGKPASQFIRQIKKFQDLLGSHQDAVITEQRLRELLRSSKSVEAGFSVGQIVERLRKRREQVRNQFSACWKKLRKRGKDAWGR
ncbi:MAG: CYTH and CHAD domain-containing protein [Nitrospirota bacterium]|nr:MAG: CYTH and CHAD domain-containing protein [Nitrospirota bacterium]